MSIPVTLEALAKRELAVLETARGLSGTIEARFARLRATGAFAESAAIHQAYVALAAPPTSSLEALKRAIFMGWYETSEPGCFTGIGDLEQTRVHGAHGLLKTAHASGQLDSEFGAMLGWYRAISDDHFQVSDSALRAYLSSLDPHAYEVFGFTRSALEHRGQMGMYWVSIACRAA
ncbi:MAG TPA: hypothetical protein VFC25_02835 [Verrucomicrobiae bacterium]|nr:hypothetical protein [Verrucomicrobiae bacterium]